MRLIRFDDTCTIQRVTGSDEYSNDIVSNIYEGKCLYEETSVFVAQGVTVYRATIYIQGKALAKANDVVKVETVNEGPISAVVSDVDIVIMPLSREVITKLELKQGAVK